MSILYMTRGSDINFTAIWPGANGAPFDLTGWELRAFEPHAYLVDNLTLEITDAAAGEIRGRIEWDNIYATSALMGFHLWIKRGEDDRTSAQYQVNVTTTYHDPDTQFDVAVSPTGPPGAGVPPGGAPGQVAVKNSADDYDVSWATLEVAAGEWTSTNW